MGKIVIELDDSILDIAKNNQRFYPVYLFEKIWKAIVKGVSLDDIKVKIIEEKECAYADFEQYMEEINTMKYKVCCPMCENKKCVKGTDSCEAEQWAKSKAESKVRNERL